MLGPRRTTAQNCEEEGRKNVKGEKSKADFLEKQGRSKRRGKNAYKPLLSLGAQLAKHLQYQVGSLLYKQWLNEDIL